MLKLKKNYYLMGAAMTAGMLFDVSAANAQTTGEFSGTGGNNFSVISNNIATSIATVPGLITGVAYLIGILIATLGILKIKDHVENPTQTPLKDGIIRVITGGALFAFPIVAESALNSIGSDGTAVEVARVNTVELGLR